MEARMAALADRLPPIRGRTEPLRAMSELTWFRVGGPAELLVSPADEADLAELMAGLPEDVPVTVVGIGSNLLIRDGGVPGVVIRLGRGFNGIEAVGEGIVAGAAALDAHVARAAAVAGLSGLEFLRTIPGSIGGALAMNAGCYGTEVKDVLVSARAVTRQGRVIEIPAAEMGFAYRSARAAEGVVFTGAMFRGRPAPRAEIEAVMDEYIARREASQPLKARTGGSTFRNPAGFSSTGRAGDPMELKAWKLIDEAGCRGLTRGGAMVSEKHCNFLINTGTATAADLEDLGEEVRARVLASSGQDLRWEIRRIGVTVSR